MMYPFSALLAGGGPTPVIDWDWTILVQAGIFLVLFVVMRKLVFLPYLESRRERDDNVDGAKERAAQSSTDAETRLARYEAKVKAARLEAAGSRAELRGEGETKATDLLSQARGKADAKLADARERIAKSVPAAELALRTRADELARTIATKVLGRSV
jgi:F-type H+-transporting ATPase subunit b